MALGTRKQREREEIQKATGAAQIAEQRAQEEKARTACIANPTYDCIILMALALDPNIENPEAGATRVDVLTKLRSSYWPGSLAWIAAAQAKVGYTAAARDTFKLAIQAANRFSPDYS